MCSTSRLRLVRPRDMRLITSIVQQLRREWNALARDECRKELDALHVCNIEEGFMSIFRCRETMKLTNACLGKYSNDEDAFDKYKARRTAEEQEKCFQEPAARKKPLMWNP